MIARLILLTLLSLCFVMTVVATAQEKIVTAVVRDQNTHREIEDVNIWVKGTKLGTTSDYSGSFSLHVSDSVMDSMVVFVHIAYERHEISLAALESMSYVDLQPRVIPMQEVEVEGRMSRSLDIEKDIPQTVAIIDAKTFEMRGFVDAGDLLRTDHSMQVDEELSGVKTVSIRAGNSDDVVVLYNGIRLNNNYNNIFDMSLIDIEDIKRFEIIKGSNTSLYSTGAFSGVVNIVPKIEQNYNIRFQQRIGTYRSGNWGLHLYKQFNRLQAAYSYKRGGLTRQFLDSDTTHAELLNKASHHTANLNLQLSDRNALRAMFLHTATDYENQRDKETLANKNQLFSIRYSGDLWSLRGFDVSVSYSRLNEEQMFSLLDRGIKDRSLHVNAQKQFKSGRFDFVVAYQFENAKLEFLNELSPDVEQVGLKSADFHRKTHGLVSILKYTGETGSDFMKTFNVELSVRHDVVRDEQVDQVLYPGSDENPELNDSGLFGTNDWNATMAKMGMHLVGGRPDLAFDGFVNFGNNIKFPSLFQQISSPEFFTGVATQPNLNPEKTQSVEIGAGITREVPKESVLSGWQVSGSFFQTYYENKFRQFTVPGIPVVFYDNVLTAKIAGLEARSSLYFLQKKLAFDLGISRYFITDKAAFPFKSDFKATAGITIDQGGYSLQLFGFVESEQVAWLRQPNNVFAEVKLPEYSNIDVHLSKSFTIGKFKLFANFSGRNLVKDEDVALLGLAIRDRRFYFTIGAQY